MRLRGHLGWHTILSYCGVLLRAEDNSPFGTLCHFDLTAHPVAEDEIRMLEAVAPLLIHRLLLEQKALITVGGVNS